MSAEVVVKKYMESLVMAASGRAEVENVILGYMTDCEKKDARIERLEAALEIIAGRRQCIDNTLSNVQIAELALST